MNDRRQNRRPPARVDARKRQATPSRRRAPAARRGKSGKRFPWKPVLIGLVVALLAAAPLVWRWVYTVRTLTVDGSGDIDALEVARMSGIKVGARMQAIDVDRVRRGVENDGRLAFVSLKPALPGGMVLTVRRRATDALTMQAGKVLALDSDGYVIAAMDRMPDDTVPYVSGLRPNPYTVGRQMETIDGRVPAMTDILTALHESGATGYVAEINLSSLADIRIITRKGLTVLLGDRESLARKITWMAGAVADIEARGETGGQLDVSSGDKADYRPSGVVQATPEPEGAGAEGEAAAS